MIELMTEVLVRVATFFYFNGSLFLHLFWWV